MAFTRKEKEKSFNEIIWKTLEALREKASKEYKTPQNKTVIHGDWSESFMEPDYRKEFIQLVEFLSDILLQEFTKKEREEYEEIIQIIETERKKLDSGKITRDEYVLFKLEKMRSLLRLIMYHLKDKDYLKGFGSGMLEEDTGDD